MSNVGVKISQMTTVGSLAGGELIPLAATVAGSLSNRTVRASVLQSFVAADAVTSTSLAIVLSEYVTSTNLTTLNYISSANAAATYQPVGDYVTSASIDTMITGYNYITTFASATDVSLSAPTDLQTLFYSSAQSQWINRGILTTDISDIGSYITSASASTQYAQLNHTHVLASITDSGALAALDTLASASDYGLLLTSASAATTYQPVGDYLTSVSIASTYGALAGTNTWTGVNIFTAGSAAFGAVGNIGTYNLNVYTSANVNINRRSQRNTGTLAFDQYYGVNASGTSTIYARTLGAAVVNTSASEDGRYDIQVMDNGTLTDKLKVSVAGVYATEPILSDTNGLSTNLMQIRSSRATVSAQVAQIGFYGHDSGAAEQGYCFIASKIVAVTAGQEYGDFEIRTVANGLFAQRAKQGLGFVVGAPTGDDKGTGTINATAVYDDDVLLTCYVFDQAVEGSIDIGKWDNKVADRNILPEYKASAVEKVKGDKAYTSTSFVEVAPARTSVREHDSVRKFKDRIGTQYDPLDIDKYIAHFKEKKHLTSMPNEENFSHGDMSSGQWIQRLIETVEIQAIHIGTLNDRLKVLESSTSVEV